MLSFVPVSNTSDRILHTAKPTMTHRLHGGIFAWLCITPKYIVTAKQRQEEIQLITIKHVNYYQTEQNYYQNLICSVYNTRVYSVYNTRVQGRPSPLRQ